MTDPRPTPEQAIAAFLSQFRSIRKAFEEAGLARLAVDLRAALRVHGYAIEDAVQNEPSAEQLAEWDALDSPDLATAPTDADGELSEEWTARHRPHRREELSMALLTEADAWAHRVGREERP